MPKKQKREKLDKLSIWAADSETDPFDGETLVKPFVWGIYTDGHYQRFDSTQAFVAFCVARANYEAEFGRRMIVYAHNGGKFDWHFLLNYLEPYQPIQVINGRIAKFKIGECEFRDSYNILPSSLRVYQKDDIDYEIMKPGARDKRENREKIEEYLRHDCKYLHEWIMTFLREFGLHLTFAGTAMSQWQKIANIDAPETTEEFFNDISQYYYGGRVEAVQTGIFDGPIHSYDINSAYAFAGNHLHPYGESYDDTGKLPAAIEDIQRAFITFEGPSNGALPFREKIGATLTFPRDKSTREFKCTGWEFLAARETGALPWYRIKRVVTFPLAIEFNAYNEHFFKKKKDAELRGDKAERECAKFMLNGLTGKFGANPEKYEEFTLVKPKHIRAAKEVDNYDFVTSLGNLALVSRPLPRAKYRYYNVAVIASITGFVRAMLWRAMCSCERVVYVDTDNVKCANARDLSIDATKLGAWKLEAVGDRIAIAGKKLYAMRLQDGSYKTASKGVRLSPHEIEDVAMGKTVTYHPQAPTFSLHSGVKFVERRIVKQK